MRSVIFLRIASALTLVHAVLHTIGGVFGGVPPAVQPVVTAMYCLPLTAYVMVLLLIDPPSVVSHRILPVTASNARNF